MPVVLIPGTPHAEELLKWEYDDFSLGGERGRRGPRVFVEFPKMLYKAGRDEKNQIDIIANTLADNSDHQRQLEAAGWVDGPANAVARAERDELEVARLAANRAHHERRMSPEAQAEARAYDESVAGHVAEIPATPIKRRGRPKKISEA